MKLLGFIVVLAVSTVSNAKGLSREVMGALFEPAIETKLETYPLGIKPSVLATKEWVKTSSKSAVQIEECKDVAEMVSETEDSPRLFSCISSGSIGEKFWILDESTEEGSITVSTFRGDEIVSKEEYLGDELQMQKVFSAEYKNFVLYDVFKTDPRGDSSLVKTRQRADKSFVFDYNGKFDTRLPDELQGVKGGNHLSMDADALVVGKIISSKNQRQ